MEIGFVPSLLAGKNAGKGLEIEPQIWIVTGTRGVGKTSLCQQIAHRCRENDLPVGGLLSKARVQNGLKSGITLEDIQTGEIRLLACAKKRKGYTYQVGSWNFCEEVIAWGNHCLKTAANCDVVILDECGFLELEHGEGFKAGTELFDHLKFKAGFIVVRFELLEIALKRWPSAQVHALESRWH